MIVVPNPERIFTASCGRKQQDIDERETKGSEGKFSHVIELKTRLTGNEFSILLRQKASQGVFLTGLVSGMFPAYIA